MPITLPFETLSDTLPDGRAICFRPIEKEDRDALYEAFHHLSPDSVRNRFFNARLDLTSAELSFLTEVDFFRHVALVAELESPSQNVSVAIGRFVRATDFPDRAEFALTVADAYQGQGIGRVLLRQLIHCARQMGIRQLDAMVLAENKRMFNLMGSMGLAMRASTSEGISNLSLEL